jgi:serine/threonine protein kinase
MSNQPQKAPPAKKKEDEPLVSFSTNDNKVNFEILSVLGKGGQGLVYLTKCNKFRENIALKTVKLDVLETKPKIKTPMYYVKSVINMLYLSSIATNCHNNMMCSYGIIMNSKNLSQLSLDTRKFLEHFNLIYISDTLNDAKICLLYEYIEGTVLNDLVQPGSPKVSFDIIKDIVHQLLKILVHIHSLGFAHLDIKPENIMIEKHTNNLKLIDVEFLCPINDNTCVATGISRQYTSLNLYGALYNSHLAENLQKFRDHRHMLKADVFSAGLVIYALLMKKALMSSIYKFGEKYEGDELVVNLPEHLNIWRRLIERMARRDFRERISSSEALNEFETTFKLRKVYNNVDGGSLRLKGRKKLTRKQNHKSRRLLSIKNRK